jgi:putative transposase
MPRHRRVTPAGYVQHVLNRGNEKATIFHKPADYEAFLSILADGLGRCALRLLAFCLMRNHFHLVLLPGGDTEIPAYMHWTMSVHVRRYRLHTKSESRGHIYQDRYKGFLIQDTAHLLTVIRYVEANAARASLVTRAENWPWSSACRTRTEDGRLLTSDWPCPRPENWSEILNAPLSPDVLQQLRESSNRGAPYGSQAWIDQTVREFQLESTVRPSRRPTRVEQQALRRDRERTPVPLLFE